MLSFSPETIQQTEPHCITYQINTQILCEREAPRTHTHTHTHTNTHTFLCVSFVRACTFRCELTGFGV
jgi:hypothetical protein